MFEPAVARAAATRVTDEDLADLERILDAQRTKLKTGRSAIVEDTAFHHVLARATRNRAVVSIMATLNDLLVESRKLTLKQKGRPARSILGHEAVVAALRRRDAVAAAEAMREHIDQIAELLQHASTPVRSWMTTGAPGARAGRTLAPCPATSKTRRALWRVPTMLLRRSEGCFDRPY